LKLPAIPPGSLIAGTGYRLLMASSAARLMRRRDPSPRAVAAALRTTALGLIPAEERAWIDRIDAHRRRLPALVASVEEGPASPRRPPSERLAEASRACQWMSLPPIWAIFLARLVRELAPRSSLELGTGFGISTAFQAAALELNGSGTLLSLDIEGMTTLAQPGLDRLGLERRAELVPGMIEDTLSTAVERAAPIDYALLDADHTEHGTLTAFDAVLPRLSAGAVVVVDDINWTAGMRRAWQRIRHRERVSTAVGLRRLGIVIVSARNDSR
jgi:predicted O-methyltransferase YrrM